MNGVASSGVLEINSSTSKLLGISLLGGKGLIGISDVVKESETKQQLD